MLYKFATYRAVTHIYMYKIWPFDSGEDKLKTSNRFLLFGDRNE